MRALVVGTALAVAAAAGPAGAEESAWNSHAFLRGCRAVDSGINADNVLQAGFCAGFVSAVAQADLLDEGKKMYCVPNSFDIRQHSLVWGKFLQDHPEHLHLPPLITLRMALVKAFPCR